jgi:Ca2+/Na+ antiporter
MVIVIYYNDKQSRKIKRMIDEYPEMTEMINLASAASSQKLDELEGLLSEKRQSQKSQQQQQTMLSPSGSAKRNAAAPPSSPSTIIEDVESFRPPPVVSSLSSAVFVEDVEDATAITRTSHNSYYERLSKQITIALSTPIREMLKILVPSLHAESSPAFNVFNVLYLQYLQLTQGSSTSSSSSISSSLNRQQKRSRLEEESSGLLTASSSSPSSSFKGGGMLASDQHLPLGGSVSSHSSSKDNTIFSEEEAIHLVPVWRALLVVLFCIFCISVFASIIIFASESLIKSMGVDTSKMGVTLVAFGSEVFLDCVFFQCCLFTSNRYPIPLVQ